MVFRKLCRTLNERKKLNSSLLVISDVMLLKSLFKYWTYQVFSPGTVLRGKYEAFKLLLENDKCAHEVMAELEEIYHNQIKVDFKFIEAKYDQFSTCVLKLSKI